jgi:diadenosine tetraphosphate (Ap4A) HIT family hydrolase
MARDSCPFCSPGGNERVFHSDDLIVALWDGFPVSPGHALVVPRRHVAGWFDATPEERAALVYGLDLARAAILERYAPDGFNIGINVGEAAGQTVFHLHVHLIPRYKGDVEDPRGGVRHVVPSKARYWEES